MGLSGESSLSAQSLWPSSPTGRGVWLRTRRLKVRIFPRLPITSNDGGPCSKGATDPCKVGEIGSIPMLSTIFQKEKSMRFFIDIDGTMTDSPEEWHGNLRVDVLDKVLRLIQNGHEVVVWSARGADYAKEFVRLGNLDVVAAIGKPDVIVDDKPTIRPEHRLQYLTPEEFVAMK